jgi:serine/threonine protein kinase
MEAWRNYLAKLPGKAPKLQRKFRAAGEVAIHLLTRLLEFDPQRRPSCDEAMLHEYFQELRDEIEDSPMADDVMLQNRLGSLLLHHNEEVIDYEGKPVSESTSPTRVASEEDPARALAMLEIHLENILVHDERNASENEDCFCETTQKLLALLEAECKAVQQGQIAFKKSIDGRSKRHVRRVGGGLLEDQGASIKDNSDYARERLSNVADTRRGGELDPTKFLAAHRHGEWSAQSGSGHEIPPGPRWGVSTSPPGGVNPMDPRIRKILTKQQGR